MKTRLGFVTNSSTANYLVINGKIKGVGETEEEIRNLMVEFLDGHKLTFYYYGDTIENKIMLEKTEDYYDVKMYLDIPHHMVMNDINTLLHTWFLDRGLIMAEFEKYIHAEYDG